MSIDMLKYIIFGILGLIVFIGIAYFILMKNKNQQLYNKKWKNK